MSTKSKADITALVIQDAAKDRKRIKDQVKALIDEVRGLEAEANDGIKPLVEALIEAEAELRAHERYEGHVARQEYDEEHRRLEKAVAEAKEAREAYVSGFRDQAKPLQERLEKARTEEAKMDAEWRIHARTAKVAKINLDELEA